MHEETKRVPASVVIGVSQRTSHVDAMRDIGALWQKAGAAGLLAGSGEAWAVYDRYRLVDGGYEVTVTVGRLAKAGERAPAGLTEVPVPAQRCLAIATDGSIDAVQKAWGSVWQRWPDGGPRAFVADAERWRVGPDGKPSSADVMVGLRD